MGRGDLRSNRQGSGEISLPEISNSAEFKFRKNEFFFWLSVQCSFGSTKITPQSRVFRDRNLSQQFQSSMQI